MESDGEEDHFKYVNKLEPEDDPMEIEEGEIDDTLVDVEQHECGDPSACSHSNGEEEEEEEDYQFQVLTAEQILQHMVECIREVNDIIQNAVTITRILLSHFNWDKDKLFERYFDGNVDNLYSECHVINPGKKPRVRVQMNTRSSTRYVPCQICYLNFPSSCFTGLECGHRFCMQCWGDYLTTKIMEEGMGQTISCPAHSCDILVDDDTVMRLITDSEVKVKYQHLITNSFYMFFFFFIVHFLGWHDLQSGVTYSPENTINQHEHLYRL
uniref:RBR-type E3 ubiquitin transferase n=1 Tax=Cynoglossus semilaevis TaxID=244447 RepID=A0A3P8WB83_CYNSE